MLDFGRDQEESEPVAKAKTEIQVSWKQKSRICENRNPGFVKTEIQSDSWKQNPGFAKTEKQDSWIH
eukprot:SAG11_NODE_32678_length_281_cov_1.950549_1_plen_66_part_10